MRRGPTLDRFWIVALLALPVLAMTLLPSFGQRMVALIGIYALLGVGYQLVFGQLGALSLAQGALFGVGAYVLALTAPRLGVFAFPIAMVAAAVVAGLAAAPTLRLQSHYFALATLALAALVNLVAINAEGLTGGANGLAGFSARLPRLGVLLVVVWSALAAAVFLQVWLFRGRAGEAARLLREAPLVAATLGIDGGLWRVFAFVASGAIAGFAGACAATVSGVVSPEATGFPIMLLCLTSVVLGGTRHPMGAVLGAALAVGLPEFFRDLQGLWLLAYAGATLAIVLWAPEGLAGLIDRLRGIAPAAPAPLALPDRLAAVAGPRKLTLDKVSKRFGGVDALIDVSFTVTRGEIVGLIGANGSGKTTLLNVVCGLNAADSGTIALDDRRIDRLAAHAIARAGIGRTFQTLLPGETRAGDLARAVASGAAFLLLDEPAAGATELERAELARSVARLRDSGRSVMIVDHDVELLSRLCDRLICLDRGMVIATGQPDEVRADLKVQSSFLGVPMGVA